MYPILARLGSHFVYSYMMMMGLGLAAAITLAYGQLRHQPSRWRSWFDGLLVGLMAGFVVGRALFVWGNSDYFRANPQEAWQIGLGGVNYHGVVITGILVFALWQRGCRQDVRAQLGAAAWPLVAWSLAGWLACYLEGCAYGQVATLGWFSANLPDSYGVFAVRVQTQLLGAGWSGFVGVVLAVGWWRGRVSDHTLFGWVMFLLCLGRAVINIWRGDPMPQWHTIRWDTLADAFLALLALTALLWPRKSSRSTPHAPL